MKKRFGFLALMLALCLLVAGAALAEDGAALADDPQQGNQEDLEPGHQEDQQQSHQKDDKGNWIHNYKVEKNEDAVLVWPTCEENGLIRFTCEYASEYETVPELQSSRDFQEYVVYSEGHDYPETWEGAVALGPDRRVSYKEPTCTEPGSITVKCGHQKNNLDYDDVKFTGYSKCDGTKTYEIPATGHVWSDSEENNDPDKPRYKVVDEATCTEKGLMVNYCTKCGVEGKNTVVTDMIPHDWENDPDMTTLATCVAEGKTVHSHTCKVCKKHETSEDEDYDHDNLDPTEILPIDPKAHAWDREPDEDWHEDYKDYTKANADICYRVKEYRLCKVCHNAKEERERDVAHYMSDWKTTKKATCFETGMKVRKCLNDGCKYTEENVIPINPKNHPVEYREKDPDPNVSKEPTCTHDGVYVYNCTACMNIEGSEWKAVAQKTINKLDHKEKTVILNGKCAKTKAAELPNLTVTYCIREGCDGELVDEKNIWANKKEQYETLNPNAEVFSKTIPVNVLSVVEGDVPDHDWTEWKKRNDPDDRGPGYWIRQCNVCGIHEEVISDTDPSKPDEPVEPKNGLVQEEDGRWRYYENDKPSTATGLTSTDGVGAGGEWYYLANGYVDTSVTQFIAWNGASWLVIDGHLDNKNNGLVEFNGNRYAISQGMLWDTWTGIWWIGGENYLLSQGKWNSSYNGVVYQEGYQIVIKNGQIDFDCTSITIDGVEYPVVNGIIQFQ